LETILGQPDTRQARIAILVLGMHRSGTSALARLLGYLGAALPGDAIEAHSDNAKGYWESAAIVKADDQLLRVARSSWFDPRPLDLSRLDPSALRSRKDRIWEAVTAAFGDAPLMTVKDPRQCRFVPTIVETLAEHGVASRAVLMLRNSARVVMPIASSVMSPRSVIDFSALTSRPRATSNRQRPAPSSALTSALRTRKRFASLPGG
jgi:hypothetical protein